jgi:ABC-type dipeptide/oligopeptide/nickel transport systems, permease components
MKSSSVLQKILYALITIIFVVIFNYFLFRVLPGDPISMIMRNPKASPETIAHIRASYGLDKPWYVQFLIYMKGMFTGDFGTSFVYKKPVMEVIGPKLIPTILMLGIAEIIAIIIGIYLGVLSAWKRGSKLDVGTLCFSLVTYSMPTFWLGMIMVAVFCVNLQIFPIRGMTTAGAFYDSGMQYAGDVIHHLILPVITMSILLIGEYSLTMRNTLIDVLSEDYITTARAKGFKERYVLKKHAMPNAMLPMVTIIAINLGLVVAGAVQIETIFSWPGIGNLMYESLSARDYPVLQGIFLIVTVCVILANLITDLIYDHIDPRVRN